MDDPISRQAAVDIAKDLIITINGYEQHNQAVNNYSAKIMQLPPTQPEPHYDEWCTDCKEYDTERHCCPRWNRVIRQTVADAQPAQHIDADGTLWITVPDIKQVKRVIVDEEKSKFCRQFYMEEEQRTGKWERHYSRSNVYEDLCWHCSACGYYHADDWTNKFKFCPNCGAKMEGANNETD